MDYALATVRVVYLSHAARHSGAEIGLRRFIEATRGRIESTVILAENGDLVPALEDAGAEVVVLPLAEDTRSLTRGEMRFGRQQLTAATQLSQYVLRLRAELVARRPDLVHAISLKSGPYGAVAGRMAGIPTIWHLHDHLIPEYLPPRVVPPMRLLAGTLPDGLLTPSQSVLRAAGHRRPGMVTGVIPFPVPRPPAPVRVRDEVRVIGMVGRLTHWKGQHVFLEAFARAFPEGPVRARIVGNAMFGEKDYEHSLHDLVERLGIADRVDFLGFIEDIDGQLQHIDVLVHASISADPLPGVVIEGMGAGLPVIASNSGGTPEYMTDGVDGILHQPGDVDDLARALRQAAGPRPQRAEIGAHARETVRCYEPEPIVERMLAFYGEVLGQRPLVPA